MSKKFFRYLLCLRHNLFLGFQNTGQEGRDEIQNPSMKRYYAMSESFWKRAITAQRKSMMISKSGFKTFDR